MVSKVFQKLVNNMIIDDLEKCGLFSHFQYGFKSSRSTADPLTVVSDRIARVFNRTGATQAVALDTSRAFDRVWLSGLLHKLKSFQVRYLALFLLFSVIDGFKWFWIENLHKNSQLMLEFLKAPFSVLHSSYYTLMTFLTMVSVILLSMMMILLSVLTDQASDLWQQLELGSALECALRDIFDMGKKWLVDFNAAKAQVIWFN